MTTNLLQSSWTDLEDTELRFILYEHIGRPGQYNHRNSNPNIFYLPLAGPSCQIKLIFSAQKQIAHIEPGPAFDATQWEQVVKEIQRSGPYKVGRDCSFSSFRVNGSWRGERSGVQILPPPADAPRAPVEMAKHPFIIEYPVKVSDLSSITNFRRMREHRRLTLLLNVLLAGNTAIQPRRPRHLWAIVHEDGVTPHEVKWVQEFYFAKIGDTVRDELSSLVSETLEEVDSETYFARVVHDGRGLQVPADLDDSICCYMGLSKLNADKFDRAIFWMDLASRQWNISVSASFAALVSAIESLTGRGESHSFKCPICDKPTQHEMPGATRRFKDFFEIYAPDPTLAQRRDDMYSLRSGILHGSNLMQIDQDLAFGWDPPMWNESKLHNELWGMTRLALRNWLKNPPII